MNWYWFTVTDVLATRLDRQYVSSDPNYSMVETPDKDWKEYDESKQSPEWPQILEKVESKFSVGGLPFSLLH